MLHVQMLPRYCRILDEWTELQRLGRVVKATWFASGFWVLGRASNKTLGGKKKKKGKEDEEGKPLFKEGMKKYLRPCNLMELMEIFYGFSWTFCAISFDE